MGASAEDKKTFEVGETITVEYKDLGDTWIAIYQHEDGRTDYSDKGGNPSFQYAYTIGTGKVDFNKAGQEGVTNHKLAYVDGQAVDPFTHGNAADCENVWYNGPSPDKGIPGLEPLPVGTYDVVLLDIGAHRQDSDDL
mgnify:FL=1